MAKKDIAPEIQEAVDVASVGEPGTLQSFGLGSGLHFDDDVTGDPVADEGLRKAAILLVTLEEEVASEVFKRLSDKEAKILSQEIIRLGFVDNEQLQNVLEEVREFFGISGVAREGGADHAYNLLRKSFPSDTADRIINLLAEDDQQHPFEFLKNAEVESLYPYLQEEHPQTIALVLAHMEPGKAASVLGRLPADSQSDIVKRIATIEHTSPETIKQVESGLKKSMSSLSFGEIQDVSGVKACAEILNVLDRRVEKTVLESLETDDSELSNEIKKLMFVFEDVVGIDDRGIQAILKEVDNNQLALALKTSTPELQEKILSNMSTGESKALKKEMEFLGPVRVSDVQDAQQGIVEIARRLKEAGEVVIAGRGGEGGLIE